MSKKTFLRLLLLIYCIALLAVQEVSLHAVIVNGAAVALSMAADTASIVFLQSRKPAEKTVLNRLFVLNFSFKILLPIYYFTITCIGYSASQGKNIYEALPSTIFNYASFKLMADLILMGYIALSLTRLLLFISPSLFFTVNTKVCICIVILIQVSYAVPYLYILVPCEIDQQRNGVHSFVFAIFKLEREEIIKHGRLTKTCFIFPTARVFGCLLLAIEGTRLVLAARRDLSKKVNMRKISPSFAGKVMNSSPRVRSASLPNIEFQSRLIPMPRRLSLQINIVRKRPSFSITAFKISQRRQQVKNTLGLVFDHVYRTYSLIVFIVSVGLSCYFLPISFYKIDRLQILIKLVKLDIFFVPIFWLLIDKPVWHFTTKNIKKLIKALEIVN